MLETPQPWESVLEFWLGTDYRLREWPASELARQWFSGGPGLDAEIEHRFGALVDAAVHNELLEWEPRPEGRLALILLLDQFTRNIHRGKSAAYRGDHRAQTLVEEGLALNMDVTLPWAGRVFFVMPFMHAEDAALQERSVRCFQRLHDEAPPEVARKIADNIKHAEEHRDLIRRFGRFPHRNKALGRKNTPEEEAFLRDGKRYGQ